MISKLYKVLSHYSERIIKMEQRSRTCINFRGDYVKIKGEHSPSFCAEFLKHVFFFTWMIYSTYHNEIKY